ncbi:MAG TPA: helical backbone metal receptor [Vicinamibacterales bacterium]|nr:helical backbone metal receptor [Vicinamibacterales bacterium]
MRARTLVVFVCGLWASGLAARGDTPAAFGRRGIPAAVGATLAFHDGLLAVQERPGRIISLIPAVTEMLFAIDAGPQVVAVSSFDDYPPEVRGLERVGALLNPDLERILSLKPDLVVAYATQDDLIARLARARVPTFRYEHAGLADVTTTIRALGGRIGRQTEAARLAARIEADLNEIRRRVAGRPRPSVLLVFGREARSLRGIHASGGVGFLHDMLVAAGGANVFADVPRQAVQATSELVLARQPEVILEIRGGEMSPAQQRHELDVWRSLPAVPAVRTGRLTMFNDPRTVVPGPRVAEGTRLIAAVLHPEAFR